MTPTESMRVAFRDLPVSVDIAALKAKGWMLGNLSERQRELVDLR